MERRNGSHHSKNFEPDIPLPENPLLAVSAATVPSAEAPGFETWLACDLGGDVLRRIAESHASSERIHARRLLPGREILSA